MTVISHTRNKMEKVSLKSVSSVKNLSKRKFKHFRIQRLKERTVRYENDLTFEKNKREGFYSIE